MTMQNIPAHSPLSKQHHLHNGYSSDFRLRSRLEGYEYKSNSNTITTDQSCLGSEHHHQDNLVVGDPMAEDESRTNSLNEGAGSSSKGASTAAGQDHNHDHHHDDSTDDKEWLRLSIGAGNYSNNKNKKDRAADQLAGPGLRLEAERLVELDLLPPAGTSSSQVVLQEEQQQASSNLSPTFYMAPEIRDPRTININTTSSATTNYYNYNYNHPASFQHGQHQYHHHQHHHQVGNSSTKYFGHHQQGEINWAFKPPIQYDIQGPGVATSSSSTTSSFFPRGSYFSRPVQLIHPAGINNNYNTISGQSSDIQVIDPPRRPHSGIWFMLQASESQGKEPFLPQISKSYMRIKDGRMTVRLLIKYLANKLRLDSESEIEITCRGQQLLPFFTLQHVRDSIWSNNRSRDELTTLLPDSPTADHLMLLQYARTP